MTDYQIIRLFRRAILLLAVGVCSVFAQELEPFSKPIEFPKLSDRFAMVSIFGNTEQRYFSYFDADSTDTTWHYSKLKEFRIPRLKREIESDSLGQYFTITQNIGEKQFLFPMKILVSDYIKLARYEHFHKLWNKKINKDLYKSKNMRQSQKKWEVGLDVGDTRVSLGVKGNVNIQGRLENEKKNTVLTSSAESQATSFVVDQKQQFNIEGKIGNLSVLIDQDSERDFDWENAMKISYKGDEDKIFQQVNVGQIGLSLPSSQLVMSGQSASGLFGIKTLHKIGALDLTTIAATERGKKNQKKLEGESSAQWKTIHDYDYRKNLYFFVNNQYRTQFYDGALENGQFTIQFGKSRQITELEIYKTTTEILPGVRKGIPLVNAHLDSINQGSATDTMMFVRLEPDEDYYFTDAQSQLGFFRMTTPLQDNDVIAITYKDAMITGIENGDYILSESDVYAEGGYLLSDSSAMYLKLIKPRSPTPNDPTWNLEFKNVYYLGGQNIPDEGFEIKIEYTQTNDPQLKERNADGIRYLHVLGLDDRDKDGNHVTNGDGLVDKIGMILNLQAGEMMIPFLRPFDAQSNPRILQFLSEEHTSPEIYDETNSTKIRKASKFNILVKYESKSSTVDLGFNIIENSEEVKLNGVKLVRGVDYTIDYFSGTLTLLNKDALDPNANLDITWDENQFFSLDKKVLIGNRAEIRFGDEQRSFLGATWLYYSKSTIDQKVRVGEEPMRNFIYDVAGKFDIDVNWLTKGLNWLPLIKTKRPSRFTLESEFAQILPNPNTINNPDTGDPNGVAYLDDFEASKQTSTITIMRSHWTHSSPPEIEGFEFTQNNRSFAYWYNPYNRVPTQSIWPDRDMGDYGKEDNKTDILRIVKENQNSAKPDTLPYDSEQSWAGIIKTMSAGSYDQTSAKFLEMWIKGEDGKLTVDLGQISEDYNGNGRLDTEDIPVSGFQGNGVLDAEKFTDENGNNKYDAGEPYEDLGFDHKNGTNDFGEGNGKFDQEDVGIDRMNDDEEYEYFAGLGLEPGVDFDSNDPAMDNYEFDTGKISEHSDYRKINGTEGNRMDQSGAYPNTEDLNQTNSPEKTNSYYSFTFSLDPESPDFNPDLIAGETIEGDGTLTGWKQYRIPLNDYSEIVGGLDEDFNSGATNIEMVRIVFWSTPTSSEQSLVQIASMELAGNEWLEEGVASSILDQFEESEDFSVAVINTEDNPDIYQEPPDVEGEIDIQTQRQAKEQSLVLKYENLRSGSYAAAYKTLYKEVSLIEYKRLKMFVHGDENQDGKGVRVVLRFGLNKNNFYEIWQPVYAGWDERNNIELDFETIGKMKAENKNFMIDEDGRAIRIYGDPSLLKIKWLQVGVLAPRNFMPYPWEEDFKMDSGDGGNTEQIGSEMMTYDTYSGEIWLDELRLSDVERNAGIAFRVQSGLSFADLGNVHFNYDRRDADFHIVSDRLGSNNNTEKISASASLNLNKFLPSSWGFNIPVSANYIKNNSTPKYLPGQDVKVIGEVPDSIKTISENLSGAVSLKKKTPSDFWLIKSTIDRIFFKFNASQKLSSNVQYERQWNETYGGEFSYKYSTRQGSFIHPFAWMKWMPLVGKSLKEWKWYYTPTLIDFSTKLNEKKNQNTPRSAEPEEPIQEFGGNGSFKFGYKIWEGTNFNYEHRRKHNLDMLQQNKEDILKYRKFGIPTEISESVGFKFNPKFLNWLSPQIDISGGYAMKDPKNNQSMGGSLGNKTTMSGSLNLNLKRMVESVYKPGGSRGKSRSGRTQSESEDKKSKKSDNFILKSLHTFAGKINPIQFSYKESKQVNDKGAIFYDDSTETIFNPNWEYRFGLSGEHGLKIAGDVGGDVGSVTKNKDFSIRSGLKLTRNITTDFNFGSNQSVNVTQTQTRRDFSQNYLPLGDDGKSGKPFVGWTIRWVGWEKMPLLEKFTKSISLEHMYNGQMQESYLNGDLRSSSYSKSFSPLIGATMTFPFDIRVNTRYTLTTNWNNTQGGTDKSDSKNMTFSLTYKLKSGIRLPWFIMRPPFIRMKSFPNTIDFSLTFDNSSSETFTRNSEEESFTIKSTQKNWKLVPKVTYSFSSKVTGSAFFEYGKTSSLVNPERTFKNYGFDINLAIRG